MNKKHIYFIMVPLLIFLSAFSVTEDIISRLGLKHEAAQNVIFMNLTSIASNEDHSTAYIWIPRTRFLPEIIKGDKVAAANELAAYIKSYVNSEEFLINYQKKREESRPTSEPEPMSEDLKEMFRSNIREMETNMEDMKKQPNQSQYKPYISQLEAGIAEQKATLAVYEDPTPNKTKWERDFPADPSILVERKLNDYLSLVSAVDFSAQLQQKGKTFYFENPEYERQSPQWKACFRAGKEVNNAITVFVKDWLKGDLISGPKVIMPKDSSGESTASTAVVNTQSSSSTAPPKEMNTDSEENEQPVKEKKGLLGKLKDKTRTIINN